MSVDNENVQWLRMQSWVLIGRLLMVSFGIAMVPTARIPLAVGLGLLLAVVVAVFLMVNRNCWLPYCYLAASALWAGYGAGLCLDGQADPALLFVICLIVVDASAFVSSWRRRWL